MSRLLVTATLLFMLVPPCCVAEAADDVTEITLTKDVVVEDCSPFGIMLGGDNYYSGSVLKKARDCWNFEGTTYRQCPWGPAMAEDGLISWFGVTDERRKIYAGADVTVLSGPSAGTSTVMFGNTRIKAMSSMTWCVAPSPPTVMPAWVATIFTFSLGYAIDCRIWS